jgi:hypothetical protein
MTNQWQKLILCCAGVAIACILSGPAWGDEPKPAESVGHYDVAASLFSCVPSDVLGTYRRYPSGSAEAESTLMLGVGDHDRQFKVSVLPKLNSKRFLVTVKIEPEEQDKQTQAMEREVDLSELKPQLVELTRDADGRVYQLDISPRIIENLKPKQFNTNDLHMESWGLSASPIILNDQDYIGQLGVSGGPLAWCDIPGLAKIEFSLLRFKDAQPIGTLSNGVIKIEHVAEGTTLQIANVKNGINGDVLSGGPYQVWVRWNKPTETMDQYRQSLKKQIAKLEKRAKEGDASLPPETLQRLEKMSTSDHAEISSFGVRQIYPDEKVEPTE